jgi:hypothetical protein
MNLDDYLRQSAPAGDQRGDDSTAIPDLLNCLSRAAVDTTVSYIQGGADMKQRVAVKLGDTLWYVAAVARRLGLRLSAIAKHTLSGRRASSFDAYMSLLPADRRIDHAHGIPSLLNGLSRAAIDSTSGFVQEESDTAQVANGLGTTLFYIAAVSRALELSLSQIARDNLTRITKLFGSSPEAPKFFDDGYDTDEQLPRMVSLRISESKRNELATVRLSVQTADRAWLPIGSPLNDNAHYHDDYRYHDVLHLAYMATLGWSPVMRALFGLKRKSNPAVDRVEDGARAALLEEALTGFIYEAATDNNLFENTTQLERHLLLTVKRLTRGLEVSVRTYDEWNSAILAGYLVFREITAVARAAMKAESTSDVVIGTVHVDMNGKTISFDPAVARVRRDAKGRRRK